MKVDTVLGHYRITGKLGEGGMGEVYRADDQRLRREVAIKVLPLELSRDPERLARLEREAQLLAALEHPNIAGIHGLEEATPEGSDPVRFLVMQLAEGRPLSERIADGAVPLKEALQIGVQIARALEAAHERGIVHRDLKPANIMLGSDGTAKEGAVKLLDFGLAKAFAPDGTPSSPDVTASPTMLEATRAGVILGTAGYMSPEQARGQQVDRRTDIWAFGCVLYEMLTGTRTFDGATVTDVLGGIVRGEPDWEQLPAETPRRIRALLRRCLRKDASRRIQAIGDARVSLEEYLEDPEEAEAILGPDVVEPVWKRWAPWGVAAAFALLAVALGLRSGGSEAQLPPPMRVSIELTQDVLWQSVGASAVLSPDGRRLAYVTGDTSRRELYIRSLDQLDSTLLVEGLPYSPFFSPDGQWVGYVTRTELMRVPVSGGTPQKMADLNLPRGATWGSDNTVVYAPGPGQPLMRVPMVGGTPEQVTELDEERGEVTHRWPEFLPDGRHVLFTSHTEVSGFDRARIELLDLETGNRRVVHDGGSHARYAQSGHLLYVQGGTVFAVPFDLDALEVTGASVPVIDGAGTFSNQGDAQFSVSDNGTLVYRVDVRAVEEHPVLAVDATGRVSMLWDQERAQVEPRLSPDGNRLAITVLENENWDIWIYDLERRVPTRFTFDPAEDSAPIWSRDGEYLYFSSDRGGAANVYRKRADGSGDIEQISDVSEGQYPNSVHPGGDVLIVQTFGNSADYNLELIALDGSGEITTYLETQFAESEASFSPDGNWVAYGSTESGDTEIYVRPYPMAGGKWQISDAGGNFPRWSADGTKLFYRDDEGVMSVDVQTGGGFRAGRPQRMFTGNFLGGVGGISLSGAYYPDFDARSDGEQFVLFPRGADQTRGHEHVTLVVNWFEELVRATADTTGGRAR